MAATIFIALRLPQARVESLISGSAIAIISTVLIEQGKQFALCPETDLENIKIETWAKCELSEMLDETTPIDLLSSITSYSLEFLQAALNRPIVYLAYLRVYRLPTSIEIQSQAKGNYVKLPKSIYVEQLLPVISDRNFEIQKERLLKLEPPETLIEKIERMLNESVELREIETKKELAWIETIVTLGDRSIEQDQGKSTYQAGTDFENISKQGLEFLGFTIDESHKGGAGGLDLFCSKPYPLTGECKAGKSVPSGTTEELIKLGGMRLGSDRFLESKKLIIGAGKVSSDVIKASHEWKVSIIKAMTLQKLVELKTKYDGAINLFELKKYLQAGQIDQKIDEYIEKIEKEIELRSHIVELVKNNHEQKVGLETLFGAYPYSNPPRPIREREEMREILIELSSPLTGYLGREKDDKGSDRFYFLRDLAI